MSPLRVRRTPVTGSVVVMVILAARTADDASKEKAKSPLVRMTRSSSTESPVADAVTSTLEDHELRTFFSKARENVLKAIVEKLDGSVQLVGVQKLDELEFFARLLADQIEKLSLELREFVSLSMGRVGDALAPGG